MNITKLINIVGRSAIYVPADCEGMRIDYYDTLGDLEADMTEDELGFYATGEESGEQYKVSYSEVDLEKDMFYELKLVDINAD